ncbi:MAG TPA: aminotransferase class I/II-fold pyridoxal phosphate-dependent enzyme [Mycetocola sp.]|jgi:DNA-binding transcriptional MocR family regulator|nr:aminotransferase class I/II-fold pyridoxal phosphate-dependent enzyme [Mycetocola sp.]
MNPAYGDLIDDRSPRGIAESIARLITTGVLAPGDRLPTVRELGAELGVSPATVSAAWRAMGSVGLIVSRGRSGSFVRASPVPWLTPRVQTMAGHMGESRLDLSRGAPDPLLLPDLTLALSRVSQSADTFSYQELPVIPPLLEHLRAAWPYEVEAITVVDGALDALSRSLEQVIRFGDRVIVEDPSFPPFFDLLDQLGAVRIPVPVDAEGLDPAALRRALALGPAALILQPRAQNPTGISMTVDRAGVLARIIRSSRHAADMIVIEDDHSAGISASTEVSLGGWLPERVMHIRSYSKSHGPDLRIAALGGPERLINQVVARRMLGPGWTSRMVQTILYELLTSPDAVNSVAAARSVYHSRQRQFAEARRATGFAAPQTDGLNTWIEVADERQALVHLAASGIRVTAGSPYLSGPANRQFVRVTVGMLRDDFREVCSAIAAVAPEGSGSAGAGQGTAHRTRIGACSTSATKFPQANPAIPSDGSTGGSDGSPSTTRTP